MTMPTTDPTPHLVVRASAGAGKTYQLTTRYLDLIARHESAQNVLATTFTRKAAGEVLGRVLGRLAGACADGNERRALSEALGCPLSSDACIVMLRSLTHGLNRLSVGTIDGFFNRAARAMSIELGLPPDPRLIDEGSPLAKQMRTDAIHAVLGEQAEHDGGMTTLIEMLRRLHHDTAQRSVTEAIDNIVKDLSEVYQSYPDRALWQALPTTGRLPAELLNTAIQVLEGMASDLPRTKSGGVHSAFSRAYNDILTYARLGRWDSLLGNGLIKKIIAGEGAYSRATITDDWQAAIKPLIVHAKAVRLSALSDQTQATYDLLALFDRQYEALRRAQRVLLFSDLTHLLAEGLPGMGEAGIEELCYRLDAKVTHLLLDEFQDTSLRQWAVLRPFAEQIASTSDGSRSLFCVGDTKQAIYGWRGGCAELFDAVDALPGVASETLSHSWRSSQVVLDAVNRVFTNLVGNPALAECQRAAQNWQQGFEQHAAMQQSLPGHVVLHTTATPSPGDSVESIGEEDAAAPPDAHAHYVAGYIKDLSAKMPGRSIGVLVRSRAKGQTLMHELRSLGVPAAEEGGNPMGNTPAVSAVLSAIQLTDHPGDSVSRFHVANSPLGEFLGLDAAADVDAIARRLRRSLMDEGYASVIAGWVEQLAPSCDAKSLRRLMQLIELAEGFDATDSTLRPSYFVDAVRVAKVEDPSPAAVRVMTMHASKGLEFDAVVLPDLDGSLSRQDRNDLIVLNRDSPIDPVRAVYRRVKDDEAGMLPELQAAHDQRAYEKRTEDLCLLYVAMTRARQGLHLLVRPLKQGKNGKPTTTGLSSLSYAAVLRQALRDTDNEGFAGDECLFDSGDAAWAGTTKGVVATDRSEPTSIQRAPITLTQQSEGRGRSWVKTTPSEMHDAARVSADDLLRIDRSGGMGYGTVMHALFEKVGFIEDGLPGDEVLRSAAEAALVGGVDLTQVIAHFRTAVENPAVRSLLQRSGADKLWRERRFITRRDDKLITGVFDRVHLWSEGGKHTRALLIDFKSDRVDDSTVKARVDGYADQLRLYRAALSAMLGLDASLIEAKLCFVRDGRVVDV